MCMCIVLAMLQETKVDERLLQQSTIKMHDDESGTRCDDTRRTGAWIEDADTDSLE